MDIEAVEEDGRLRLDLKQRHGLANLLRKAVWENGGEAAYDKGHPLGGESMLIVKGDNPEQVLEGAVETAREWMEDLEDRF